MSQTIAQNHLVEIIAYSSPWWVVNGSIWQLDITREPNGGQWDSYLKDMERPDMFRRHGGKPVLRLLDMVKDSKEIPLLPTEPDKAEIEQPLSGQLSLL